MLGQEEGTFSNFVGIDRSLVGGESAIRDKAWHLSMKLSSMHSIDRIKNRFTLGQKESGLIKEAASLQRRDSVLLRTWLL